MQVLVSVQRVVDRVEVSQLNLNFRDLKERFVDSSWVVPMLDGLLET